MAFTTPFTPTIHLFAHSAFSTRSSSTILNSRQRARCARKHWSPKTSTISATVNPKQNSTATTGPENAHIVISSADCNSPNDILPTPVYNPSLFTILYDIFRQDLRNKQVGRLYGPVYKADNLFGPVTMITGYSAVVEVSRNRHLFEVSKAFPEQIVNLLGRDAILFIDGDKHKTARARSSPAFLPSTIPSFHNIIVRRARAFFQSLAAKTSAASGPVDATGLVKEYFLDLILKLTMSADQAREDGSQTTHGYDATSKKLSSLFIQFSRGLTSPKLLPPYRNALRARQILDNEMRLLLLRRLRDNNARSELRHVRNCLQGDKIANVLRSGRADLMSVMIATSSLELPENDDDAMYDREEDTAEMQSLVCTLRFLWYAGYTTQSGTLLCVLMEIFSEPSLLHRLQEEQRHITEVTAQSITNDMPLLSSVLTESMRVNTAVISTFRRTTEDLVVLQHLIPKGTMVGVDYSCANIDASIFQAPEKFIPDRFVNNQELARKVLLFGAPGSAHYCIGASLATIVLKTTLAVMIREFDVDVKPWKKRAVKTLPETVPRDGVWIRACVPKEGERVMLSKIHG